MDDMLKKALAGALAVVLNAAVKSELPKAAAEIQEALNKRSPVSKVIFLASMSMVVSAMLPNLAKPEKDLYDLILAQTTTVVGSMPVGNAPPHQSPPATASPQGEA